MAEIKILYPSEIKTSSIEHTDCTHEIIYDHRLCESICSKCGLVIENNHIDYSSYRNRSFYADKYGDDFTTNTTSFILGGRPVKHLKGGNYLDRQFKMSGIMDILRIVCNQFELSVETKNKIFAKFEQIHEKHHKHIYYLIVAFYSECSKIPIRKLLSAFQEHYKIRINPRNIYGLAKKYNVKMFHNNLEYLEDILGILSVKFAFDVNAIRKQAIDILHVCKKTSKPVVCTIVYLLLKNSFLDLNIINFAKYLQVHFASIYEIAKKLQ